MNTGALPEPDGTGIPRPLSNGLAAASYVPLADVAPEFTAHLLAALARARIAAYLGEVPPPERTDDTLRRLYVAAEERADARTIVAAVLRAAGTGGALPPFAEPDAGLQRTDPALDYDAAFAELIADWHVDTIAAIREAERALSREDENWRARLEQGAPDPVWLDEHHYVPPPPPPLPRPTAPTVLATMLIILSVLMLGFGTVLGLDQGFAMLLGVGGVLIGAGLLIMRLRERPDEDDDGAVV